MINELSDEQILDFATRVNGWRPMTSSQLQQRDVSLGYIGTVDGFEVETHFSPLLFKKHNYVVGVYSHGMELAHTSRQYSSNAKGIFEFADGNYQARNHTLQRQEAERLVKLLTS